MDACVYRFFHDRLPDEGSRAMYAVIEAGIRQHQACIVLRRPPNGVNPFNILENVYDDHPEFLSLYPQKSTIQQNSAETLLHPYYRITSALEMKYQRKLEDKVECILRKLFPGGFSTVSPLEREKRIFDWVTQYIIYDHRSYNDLKEENERLFSSMAWNAYGALVKGTAVCEGIACAFKLLCDRVDLPCIVVLGMAGERHAWNMVKISNRFYHVDCTWDLDASISKKIPYARYRYFNLPDEIMSFSHKPESSFLPRCGSLRYNPFRIRDLCVTKPEELFPTSLKQWKNAQYRFALMAIGFTIDQIMAQKLTNELYGVCHRAINWYLDTSGFFVGIEIV